MSRPAITVGGSEPLRFALTVMLDHRVSGLPVTGRTGRVRGVLSQQDVLRVLHNKAGLALPAGLFGLLVPLDDSSRLSLARRCERVLTRTLVREAMSSPAVCIDATSSVDGAVRTLLTHRINRLPVLERGRLVGVVTRTDLLTAPA